MAYENLSVVTRGGVHSITIKRPSKLNALNRQTLQELYGAVIDASGDDKVRVIVITGSGDKAFVAGADVAEIRELTPSEARRFSQFGQNLMSMSESLDKPVIAAINGFALGGGLELALACHLRIATRNARLGLPEIKLGIMPGFGGTQRLARLIGKTRALELVLGGEPIAAERGMELGLINKVAEPEALDEAVRQMAEPLVKAAPEAVLGILQATLQGADGPLENGLALETARFALCCSTEDMREGTAAFLEKRPPKFRDR
ncbi:MAG: enoyl-CoA hydratase-related protein [Wenzhouxiangella sp.]|jgi:enoyl-CoA hydratase|nr:enoyl-CoA hydratase-related protein [Wenzhouxiangella sp.]